MVTKGVGVFNYVEQPPFEPRSAVRRFLYVGRLTEVKNLPFLINAFKNRLDLTLNIVGFGELEEYLKSIAGDNVNFLGAVDNKNYHKFIKKMMCLCCHQNQKFGALSWRRR